MPHGQRWRGILKAMPSPELLTLARIRDILVRNGAIPASLDLDDPDTTFVDLGVDSSSLLALQVELEEALGIRLEAEDLAYFETLGGGIDRVNARLTGMV